MQVKINALPKTIAEFETLMKDLKLTKRENTCALFLCALYLYTKNVDDGIKALNLLRGPRPMTKMDEQFIRDRLRGKEYLAVAYFEGATPANNYEPSKPYVLNVFEDPRPQDVEAGYSRVFLETKGADAKRPMKLRQKGDEYFLWEYSSIVTGIKISATQDAWA